MAVKDIRPALRAFLLGDATLSTTVGGARIYPVRLPQGITAASLVYNRISGVGDHHMQGPSGLARPRIQIDAWAPTADGASALADLVKARLDGYRGEMGSGPAVVTVHGVFFDGERDLPFDDASKLYGVSRDYFVHYREF